LTGRRLLALAPLGLAVAGLAVAAATLHAALPFSAYSTGPQGSTDLAAHLRQSGFNVTSLHTSLALLDEVRTDRPALLVMAGLAAPATARDVADLSRFVARGGRVLVADDAGFADPLSLPYGVKSGRFPVSDVNFAGNASILPVRLALGGESAVVHAVGPVLLVVDAGAQGAVVGTTQPTAFLDLDHDGRLGLKDQPGPFPVAFETRPNARGGELLFVSDASLLQNERGPSASADELDFLFRHLAGGGTVVFDERGRESGPAAALSSVQGVGEAVAATPFALLLACLALAWATAAAVRRSPRPLPAEHRHDPAQDATPPEVLQALRKSVSSPKSPESP
jgi:hypothetical protein